VRIHQMDRGNTRLPDCYVTIDSEEEIMIDGRGATKWGAHAGNLNCT
jgi:hypothetical protein